MTQPLVDRIAQSILYEGYLLYPYRASAVKNRQRFNFGVLVPQAYSQAQAGTESWTMQVECLLQERFASIRVRTRFLHLLQRQVEEFVHRDSPDQAISPRSSRPVECLEVNGHRYQTWQEAEEREVDSLELCIEELCDTTHVLRFRFGPNSTTEEICEQSLQPLGWVQRTQKELRGTVVVSATRLEGQVYRLRVVIHNETSLPEANSSTRDQVLLSSLASTHAVLTVSDGEFVSLLEPPLELADAAATCQQRGCWPVLVGENKSRQTILASPIILYDYPQIAQESPGDFFDATEIDEMLMLRVMTLTPGEQREMRCVDEQARRLLERAEGLPQEHFEKLHGALRGMTREQA
ncbi:hypothetical protein [Schlesneria paludicola]|uniref:hypothetical protein n=1 Tax=Schlesneria paludicola TaxID=360056 RepID=UPI00049278B8|nr:hypothetical protein [Schlesneria paludicola]